MGQWRAGDKGSCENQGQTVNVMLTFLGSVMAGNVFKPVRDPAGYELWEACHENSVQRGQEVWRMRVKERQAVPKCVRESRTASQSGLESVSLEVREGGRGISVNCSPQ